MAIDAKMARVARKAGPQLENPGKVFMRLMRYVGKKYWFAYISVFALIIVSVMANLQGTMFTKTLIDDYITPLLISDVKDFTPLMQAILRVAGFYAIGVVL